MQNELPKRKSPRWCGFDYSNAGAYFLTVCTEKRAKTLSKIVGEGSPLPQLTEIGEIVKKYIEEIPHKYPDFLVDHYVIMPNHIHMILFRFVNDGRGDPSPTVDNVMGWLKFQITKSINQTNQKVKRKIFQRSFYDHVIRSREDYETHRKYISENPMKWYYDDLYSED